MSHWQKLMPPALVVVLALAALACPETPGTQGGEQEAFEAKVRELEERVDPIEVEDYETAPPPPPERRAVETPPLAFGTRDLAFDAEPSDAENRLEIYVFGIGQADSMLIVGPAPEDPTQGRRTLLFDLGEVRNTDRESYLHVAQRVLDITGGTHLDYLIVSHYHDDHTGDGNDGIAGLLDWVDPQFTVGTFIDAGSETERFTADRRFTYERLVKNLERWLDTESGPVLSRVAPSFEPGQIDLGPGVTVEFLAVAGRVDEEDEGAMAVIEDRFPGRYERAPANENDLSIALEISYGDFEMFSAGDLNGYNPEDWDFVPLFTPRQFQRDDGSVKRETYTNVESHMVRRWRSGGRESDVEVYRANHHGSSYSSSPELLEALDPEFIIFSTGGGHGHPAANVIERSASTAALLATTRIASGSFPAWQEAGGRLAGEIAILVEPSGSYTIAGESAAAFSAAAEAAGEDAL